MKILNYILFVLFILIIILFLNTISSKTKLKDDIKELNVIQSLTNNIISLNNKWNHKDLNKDIERLMNSEQLKKIKYKIKKKNNSLYIEINEINNNESTYLLGKILNYNYQIIELEINNKNNNKLEIKIGIKK